MPNLAGTGHPPNWPKVERPHVHSSHWADWANLKTRGIAALAYYPALSLSFAVAWTALWLLTAGGLGVYLAVQERRAAQSWGWAMTWGIIALVAGVVALSHPGATLAWLMGFIAAFGLIGGVALLVAAWKMQKIEHDVGDAMRPAA